MKIRNKVKSGILILIIITISIVLLKNWKTKDLILQLKYDLINKNKIIEEKHQINDLMNSLKMYRFNELESSYLNYTKSALPHYKKLLKNCNYYRITRNDLYKHISYKFRIRDLVPKDKYLKELVLGKRDFIYLNIRIDVLYKLLMLQQELKSLNYKYKAFRIKSGFRHPYYNELIGGAKSSWHIRGAAIDISVRDIDKNGRINSKDKKIVIDILENKVIGYQGGIGCYPKTRIVHFDVRGYKARWDKQ